MGGKFLYNKLLYGSVLSVKAVVGKLSVRYGVLRFSGFVGRVIAK
jgi:hypothetical protein